MSQRRVLSVILVASLGLAAVPVYCAPPRATADYHMIARYPIGGNETGYDYLRVDAATRRVFVAHANRVEVLNADSGQKLGERSRPAWR